MGVSGVIPISLNPALITELFLLCPYPITGIRKIAIRIYLFKATGFYLCERLGDFRDRVGIDLLRFSDVGQGGAGLSLGKSYCRR